MVFISGSRDIVRESRDCIMLARTPLLLLLLALAWGASKKKSKKIRGGAEPARGIRCYNCLSFDHPGCWDPDHPENGNVSVPNIDCYIPGMSFLCIVITSESARLVETGQEVGAVRARTCVPARDFGGGRAVPYAVCAKLSRELAASETFSRVAVSRPHCALCSTHLCADAPRC